MTTICSICNRKIRLSDVSFPLCISGKEYSVCQTCNAAISGVENALPTMQLNAAYLKEKITRISDQDVRQSIAEIVARALEEEARAAAQLALEEEKKNPDENISLLTEDDYIRLVVRHTKWEVSKGLLKITDRKTVKNIAITNIESVKHSPPTGIMSTSGLIDISVRGRGDVSSVNLGFGLSAGVGHRELISYPMSEMLVAEALVKYLRDYSAQKIQADAVDVKSSGHEDALLDRLAKLKKLLDSEAITQEEFVILKKKLIDKA